MKENNEVFNWKIKLKKLLKKTIKRKNQNWIKKWNKISKDKIEK